MRLLAVMVGMGLALSLAAVVGADDWIELTYEEPDGWVLEVPGVDGGRQLYGVSLPAPVGDEVRAYAECDVCEYDMDAGTMTLACPGTDDVVLEFDCLWDYFSEPASEDSGDRGSSFPSDVTCQGGSCACEGKCWACCPKGFVPSCSCLRDGKCECVAIEESSGGDPQR